MSNFKEALDIVSKHEGFYVDDPEDTGGETFRGISRRYNPGWEGWENIDNLKLLANFPDSLNESKFLQGSVEKFYKSQYWNQFWGDAIPDQTIANELYDISVNLGVGRAVEFIQIGLNVLNRNELLYPDLVEDGTFGQKTLDTLNIFLQKDDVHYLLKIMNVLQGMHYIKYMKKSPVQEKHARGWFKRVILHK